MQYLLLIWKVDMIFFTPILTGFITRCDQISNGFLYCVRSMLHEIKSTNDFSPFSVLFECIIDFLVQWISEFNIFQFSKQEINQFLFFISTLCIVQEQTNRFTLLYVHHRYIIRLANLRNI